MGILNVTPNSFSDGGRFDDFDRAVAQAGRMIDEGAAIVDVGGESTGTRSAPISAAEEQDRALPVVEALVRRGDVIVSIDTYRAETARLAVAAGAHIVNDVWGLQREPEIASVAAETGAGLVIMHNSRERQTLLAGASRKRFIGAATGRDLDGRAAGTAASSAILRVKGAALFRVHDVAINVDALAVADAMLARLPAEPLS